MKPLVFEKFSGKGNLPLVGVFTKQVKHSVNEGTSGYDAFVDVNQFPQQRLEVLPREIRFPIYMKALLVNIFPFLRVNTQGGLRYVDSYT